MRKRILLLLGLAACGDATGPSDDLLVTAIVTPAQFTTLQGTTVVVTVTNVGSKTHEVSPATCPDNFIVTNTAGAELGPFAVACPAVVVAPKKLGPGEQLAFVHRYMATATTGGMPSRGGGQILAPGPYIIKPKVTTPTGFVLGAGVDIVILDGSGR